MLLNSCLTEDISERRLVDSASIFPKMSVLIMNRETKLASYWHINYGKLHPPTKSPKFGHLLALQSIIKQSMMNSKIITFLFIHLNPMLIHTISPPFLSRFKSL